MSQLHILEEFRDYLRACAEEECSRLTDDSPAELVCAQEGELLRLWPSDGRKGGARLVLVLSYKEDEDLLIACPVHDEPLAMTHGDVLISEPPVRYFVDHIVACPWMVFPIPKELLFAAELCGSVLDETLETVRRRVEARFLPNYQLNFLGADEQGLCWELTPPKGDSVQFICGPLLEHAPAILKECRQEFIQLYSWLFSASLIAEEIGEQIGEDIQPEIFEFRPGVPQASAASGSEEKDFDFEAQGLTVSLEKDRRELVVRWLERTSKPTVLFDDVPQTQENSEILKSVYTLREGEWKVQLDGRVLIVLRQLGEEDGAVE